MAFFGQPGYSVGPYSFPAQPGVFDRILQVANLGTNLLDIYQKFKDRSLKDIVAKIGIGREIYRDQPMPIDEDFGQAVEKTTGITLPRVTEQDRQQTLKQLSESGAGTVMSSQGSPMTDPNILQNKLPALGQYKPLPAPGVKNLEELIVRNLSGDQTSPAFDKLMEIYKTVKGKQQRPLYNPQTGEILDWQGNVIKQGKEPTTSFLGPNGEITTVPGNVKPNPFAVTEYKENLTRNRPTGVYQTDPRGFVFKVGDITGPNKFVNPGAGGGKIFISPDEAAANPNKQWPKNTTIIKQNDPLYNEALRRAGSIVDKDLNMKYSPAEEKNQKITEIAKDLYAKSKEAQQAGKTAPSQPQIKKPTKEEIMAYYNKGLAEGRDPELMKARLNELLKGAE